MELYNSHNYVKIFSVFLLFLGFLFLIVLFTYMSGNPSFLSIGSTLEPYGQIGEIIGTIIIVILFVIGTFLLIHYYTITNISKQLVAMGDIKAVKIINPSKNNPPNQANLMMKGNYTTNQMLQGNYPPNPMMQGNYQLDQINKGQINTIEEEEADRRILEQKKARLDEYYKQQLKTINQEEDTLTLREKEKLESNNELLERIIKIKEEEDKQIKQALDLTKQKLNN